VTRGNATVAVGVLDSPKDRRKLILGTPFSCSGNRQIRISAPYSRSMNDGEDETAKGFHFRGILSHKRNLLSGFQRRNDGGGATIEWTDGVHPSS